ncbi:sigma-70 family RNA polymerase sigma factor [Bacillus subtilis]|uniref:sigma-70 family RNA polymerase sigma factor n=1 Tax=Bacillus subtilis TaxID=1423 RepID=UPI0025C7946C|nr:sigma-70 family RNA polymerase sigma factor [Bacillus subtilis]WCS68073.1 hypothetical protein Goe26_01610 [Bacillus phage vB_BsuM-Goe26]GLI90882.1 hypothetical protein ANABIO4_42340 [Bacillus subtilis]
MTRDINELLVNYKPLILTVYKKYNPIFPRMKDKEDLMSEINTIFTQLVWEYKPRRGVDFPFYIKKMLEWRTYHYVTKQIKRNDKEVIVGSLTNDKVSLGDSRDSTLLEELELIENVMSWDDDFRMGKKQKQLFISLLRDNKTVRQIAEEEGVDISTIHTRLHFLIRKIKTQQELQQERDEA